MAKREGMVLNVYKPAGWTPVQAIERLKELRPELQGLKMAAAGRLDPMAEGVLVVVAGKALKDFDAYCRLDKEYKAEVLLGFTSDSWDVMGIIESHRAVSQKAIEPVEWGGWEEVLKQFVGKARLPLPPYSSPTVEGKPLYWWAKRGKLENKNLPARGMDIFSIQFQGVQGLRAETVLQSITERIERVAGDFRKEEILARWRETLAGIKVPLSTISFRVHCASGTYIRSIAHVLGERFGAGALLYYLARTRVGEYRIEKSTRFEI